MCNWRRRLNGLLLLLWLLGLLLWLLLLLLGLLRRLLGVLLRLLAVRRHARNLFAHLVAEQGSHRAAPAAAETRSERPEEIIQRSRGEAQRRHGAFYSVGGEPSWI